MFLNKFSEVGGRRKKKNCDLGVGSSKWSRVLLAQMRRCQGQTSWLRRLSTAVRRHVEDEGDWLYSSEWWGTESQGQTILRATSGKGNGVVSVIAYPSSRPSRVCWSGMERWLQRRFEEIHPAYERGEHLRILGYQWRVLRFNDDTRQSAAKVMAAYQESKPDTIYCMQQPHCLAVPYLKSMVSTGLATIASCNYDIISAAQGKKPMHILCIGHGGGSLPLFLASKIQGAIVHIVDIDPLVISASVRAMGFPAFSVMTQSADRAFAKPSPIDEVMWKGIHERLYLYEADAEEFIINSTNLYDMVFIDAYDGDDIFPRKLWDSESLFLKALSSRLHPNHGTVVVNLHSDSDILNRDGSFSSIFEPILPMGKYVSQVCQAYKDVLVGTGGYCEGIEGCGLAFTVAVPWVCNTSLVVCRGFGRCGDYINKDLVVHTLINKSLELEHLMNLPFSCLEYIKRDFILVD
ncbi:S-adenosyl-L-methionine-dependent methyltransferase superfamily protein [Senna tora]|uniref:S-adenosyl-L-methionine-dependent methyltransferase superfamily protein n=1 Tax=Senna tora TaxID=362788 RepID=A0A835CCB3_9FABA|nr:S-adenosyl-L-methionine-dependent methyltransferase superfamily protein [Senna tora]